MKTKLLSTLLAATVSLSFASAADKLASSDEAFIKKAAQGGLLEVKLGEVANANAKREDVKSFGKMMFDDHSKANADLKTLATSKGVELSDKLDMKHNATVDKLSKKKGDEFDGAYVQDMIKDHEEDVKEFETAANSAKDADVKAFAAKTLPTLKTHLEHVKALQGKK